MLGLMMTWLLFSLGSKAWYKEIGLCAKLTRSEIVMADLSSHLTYVWN